MNPKTKLPSGTTETVNDTVARAKSMLETAATGNTGTETKSSSVLDTLVERLTQQGQGISTSASSNLQASIDSAIASTQEAGALSSAALESERQREKSFAQDRAGATYTNAMEGRSGYATMRYGLLELTETTEKSIRDLDKRYQEAILSNDSATATRVADMQMKKLELQQETEARYIDNLFKVASIEIEDKQFNQSFSLQTKNYELDQLANDRGYEMDKIKLAQDKDLSEDELAFKYASLSQDRELTMAQINATLAKNKGGTSADAPAITSYILDSLRTAKNTAGVNTNDRTAMASQIRNVLDAAGLSDELSGSEYDTYLRAAYDIFNQENAAQETLGVGGGDSAIKDYLNNFTYSNIKNTLLTGTLLAGTALARHTNVIGNSIKIAKKIRNRMK